MITVVYSTHKDFNYNQEFKSHLSKPIGVKDFEILATNYRTHKKSKWTEIYLFLQNKYNRDSMLPFEISQRKYTKFISDKFVKIATRIQESVFLEPKIEMKFEKIDIVTATNIILNRKEIKLKDVGDDMFSIIEGEDKPALMAEWITQFFI